VGTEKDRVPLKNIAISSGGGASGPAGGKKAKKQLKEVKPEDNILVANLFADFQESLRGKFKSRKDAFDKLGGADDAKIDRQEFQAWIETIGYDNVKLNEQLYRLIDKDNDGYITRREFRNLFEGDIAELTEFRENLKEHFKSRMKAFDELGGRDDGLIDQDEFKSALLKQLHYDRNNPRLIDRLFWSIDANNNGTISRAEFKAIFQPDGETAKVIEFKDALKETFKSSKDAFNKLGGSDDCRIDPEEFQEFLAKELGYKDRDLNAQLFQMVDDNSDGWISRGEFQSLFLHHTAKEIDLKNKLREEFKEKFKSRKDAFNRLGGKDDAQIDRKEFTTFLEKHLDHIDAELNNKVFDWIDSDGTGFITRDEFKLFF